MAVWRSGTVIGHNNEVAVRRARLLLGWVTVFGGLATLVSLLSHPGQLSLLPSAGREIRTGKTAVMLCGWRVRQDGSFHMWIVVRCMTGKTVILLNTCRPERD